MNKYITVIVMLFAAYTVSGQVAVEKDAVTNASVILEFNDESAATGVAKGLILPIVTNATDVEKVEGTIFYDASDKKVKYVKSATEVIEMSEAAASTVTITTPTATETATDGVVITDGTVTTADKAVLKLESNSKAMILPRISNVETALNNPAAGTIVYDLASDSIAVFNGSVWSFWN